LKFRVLLDQIDRISGLAPSPKHQIGGPFEDVLGVPNTEEELAARGERKSVGHPLASAQKTDLGEELNTREKKILTDQLLRFILNAHVSLDAIPFFLLFSHVGIVQAIP
jgi:hypothetical protein